jgi:Dolichyl-phosphate-mannose-protein mannosyltransferase
VPRVRPGWVLAGLIAVSAVARAVVGLRIEGLWIMPDEALYAALGESLYHSGRLAVLDGPQVPYSVVYPALVGLPLTVFGVDTGYAALKVLQPAVMSLAAVPVYLWGRALMPARWALLAAALTLASPALLYSGLLMSHVAYYPLAALALWASAKALETGGRRDQALAVAAVGLAVLTRVQAVVFVPAFATAVVLLALVDRRPRNVLRFTPAAAGVGVPLLLWVAWRLAQHGSWVGALGPYSAAGGERYDAGDVARFVVYHLGDAVLLSGVLPVCAVLFMAWEWLRGREHSPAVRAYLALTVSYAVWLLVEVGTFASENAGRLLERNLQALAPLLFLGFALWLARGCPRSWPAAPLAAVLTVAPVSAMPVGRLVDVYALPDSFSLAPLLDLERWFPSLDVALVVTLVACGLAAAFTLVPRRLLAVLPALVLVWLGVASVAAGAKLVHHIAWEQEHVLGGTGDGRRWIDRAADGDVAFVYTGEPYWNGVWQEMFWNRRVRRVYTLPGVEVPGPVPQRVLRPAADGRLLGADGRPVRERYVVAVAERTFVGEPVASIAQEDVETKGLILWQVDSPLRLSMETAGVKPDGDIVESARITVYDCTHGRLLLTLLTKASSVLRIYLDGSLARTVRYRPNVVWRGALPVPARTQPHVCRIDLVPNALAGSTVLLFER